MIDLIKQYGPALLALIISYYRDQVIAARHSERIAKLELEIKGNHEKVDRDNAGVTDVDGVSRIAGPDTGE